MVSLICRSLLAVYQRRLLVEFALYKPSLNRKLFFNSLNIILLRYHLQPLYQIQPLKKIYINLFFSWHIDPRFPSHTALTCLISILLNIVHDFTGSFNDNFHSAMFLLRRRIYSGNPSKSHNIRIRVSAQPVIAVNTARNLTGRIESRNHLAALI